METAVTGCCAGGRGRSLIPTTFWPPTAVTTIPVHATATTGFVAWFRVRVGLLRRPSSGQPPERPFLVQVIGRCKECRKIIADSLARVLRYGNGPCLGE